MNKLSHYKTVRLLSTDIVQSNMAITIRLLSKSTYDVSLAERDFLLRNLRYHDRNRC